MFGFHHMGMGFFGLGWIFVLIIFGVLAWLVIMFLDGKGYGCCGKSRENEKSENPLDIVKVRYAKGEITKEEFKKMKEELEQKA